MRSGRRDSGCGLGSGNLILDLCGSARITLSAGMIPGNQQRSTRSLSANSMRCCGTKRHPMSTGNAGHLPKILGSDPS